MKRALESLLMRFYIGCSRMYPLAATTMQKCRTLLCLALIIAIDIACVTASTDTRGNFTTSAIKQPTHGLSAVFSRSQHQQQTARQPGGSQLAAQQQKSRRSLKQIAQLANLGVGALGAGDQSGINAAGVGAILANHFGIEGIGLRHRLGALPAPGGIELLALGGPLALPGPTGQTLGWIGGNVKAAAAAVTNPLTAAGAAQGLAGAAANSPMGDFTGVPGLGAGLEATIPGLGAAGAAAKGPAGGPAGGLRGPIGAAVAAGRNALGGVLKGIGGAIQGTSDALTGHSSVAVTGTVSTSRGSDMGSRVGNTAAAVLSGLSKAAGTAAATVGAVNGNVLTGAGQVAAQAASAAGQGGNAKAAVAGNVAGNVVPGADGLANMAGRFISRLKDLTTPGSVPGTGYSTDGSKVMHGITYDDTSVMMPSDSITTSVPDKVYGTSIQYLPSTQTMGGSAIGANQYLPAIQSAPSMVTGSSRQYLPPTQTATGTAAKTADQHLLAGQTLGSDTGVGQVSSISNVPSTSAGGVPAGYSRTAQQGVQAGLSAAPQTDGAGMENARVAGQLRSVAAATQSGSTDTFVAVTGPFHNTAAAVKATANLLSRQRAA